MVCQCAFGSQITVNQFHPALKYFCFVHIPIQHFNFVFSEFCPGVPWKGLQNIDPETDPNVTPGSVPSGPTINTNIQDVNRYLLRDRSGGESKEFQGKG